MRTPVLPRILFVCTGNICRSPTADGILRHELSAKGLAGANLVDSAGTWGGHQGDPPDPRTIAAARRCGYDLSDLRARPLRREDFNEFDLILGMDRGHMQAIHALRPATCRAETSLFLDFLPGHAGQDVPDPYYGQQQDFEHVLDLVIPTVKILLKRYPIHAV